jgi:hypothetical protein
VRSDRLSDDMPLGLGLQRVHFVLLSVAMNVLLTFGAPFCPFRIRSKTTIIIFIFACLAGNSSAEAAPTWFFKGKCEESRVKRGSVSEDLRPQLGDRINCEVAVFAKLKNGRAMIQFVTGTGVLGFAGSSIEETADGKSLQIDRLYPIRDLGIKYDQVLRNSTSGEGVLSEGIEGVCVFLGPKFETVRTIICTAKHEVADHREVYSVTMNVIRGTRRDLPDL